MHTFLRICCLVMLAGVLSLPAQAAAGSIPSEQLAARLASCGEDVHCQMEVAQWAVLNGHVHDADLIYRRILIRHPLMDEPYRALVNLAANRDLPKDSKAYRATRELLSDRFVEYETRRFIVLSDAEARWSRSQSEHLERAHHQFMRFVNRLSLRPLPLRHKLVCVLFEHQDDYRRFAAMHDNITDPWIVGYYSPRHDRVVFYHRSAEDEHDDEFARGIRIATTIHEAIHQLHFHTRVKSLQVQYPLWICEGLATAFETDTPNHAFGPDHEFQPRRDRFHTVLSAGETIPLRTLVSLTRMPDNRTATVRAVYHQSYALVVYLHRHRPAQLRDYLNAMLIEPHGLVDEARQVELFEQAFGRIDTLEQTWLSHERQALAQRGDVPLGDRPMLTCACDGATEGFVIPLSHDPLLNANAPVRLARWLNNLETCHAQ